MWNPIDGDSASGSYYNKTDGTGNTYCYGYSATVGTNCDYSQNGINETYRPMIKNVTWYLGGYSTNEATTSTLYTAERGTTGGGSTTSLTRDTGYIGLMYASDYGYSVLASSCARTTKLDAYNTTDCAGQSWLRISRNEWTITPNSSNTNIVFYVHSSGFVYILYNETHVAAASRPVLYLDADVYYIDGDGSISNPYIIGM